jgi:hypothetical protein
MPYGSNFASQTLVVGQQSVTRLPSECPPSGHQLLDVLDMACDMGIGARNSHSQGPTFPFTLPEKS